MPLPRLCSCLLVFISLVTHPSGPVMYATSSQQPSIPCHYITPSMWHAPPAGHLKCQAACAWCVCERAGTWLIPRSTFSTLDRVCIHLSAQWVFVHGQGGLPNFSLQMDVSPEYQTGISRSPPWISAIQRKLPITENKYHNPLSCSGQYPAGFLDTLFLDI